MRPIEELQKITDSFKDIWKKSEEKINEITLKLKKHDEQLAAHDNEIKIIKEKIARA